MNTKVNTIFGPPGTGKTRNLVNIAVEEATRSDKILALSYTKAAATEIGSRVDGDVVKSSTLHSLAYGALGVSRASVIDGKKMAKFGDECGIPFASQSTGDYEIQEGDEYQSVLQFARNRLIEPWEAYDHFGRPGQHDRFAMFIKAYPQWKHTYGFIDFDDMLERLPDAAIPRYPVVLLDEAQDCSPLQWRAFRSVAALAERVYIAGDDDQAIYEWGGSDPHGMTEYAKSHDSGYRVLGQSHRVPKSVLSMAKTDILAQISKRINKEFAPMDNDGTITRFGEFDNIPMKFLDHGRDETTMVLVRDRWRMQEAQRSLHANYIPYLMDGRSPYENKWAHAIRAMYKLNACQEIFEWERQALINGGTQATSDAASKRDYSRFKGLRWQDCVVVPAHLREFYEQAPLFATPKVTLSTIHGSKGREADNVVVDLTVSAKVESSLYLDRDAELRVMYVAITRARNHLILCGNNPLL